MSVVPGKKVKPIDIVSRITAPTLFIAGENDPTVYPWHTKTLYDKATCKKGFKLFNRMVWIFSFNIWIIIFNSKSNSRIIWCRINCFRNIRDSN